MSWVLYCWRDDWQVQNCWLPEKGWGSSCLIEIRLSSWLWLQWGTILSNSSWRRWRWERGGLDRSPLPSGIMPVSAVLGCPTTQIRTQRCIAMSGHDRYGGLDLQTRDEIRPVLWIHDREWECNFPWERQTLRFGNKHCRLTNLEVLGAFGFIHFYLSYVDAFCMTGKPLRFKFSRFLLDFLGRKYLKITLRGYFWGGGKLWYSLTRAAVPYSCGTLFYTATLATIGHISAVDLLSTSVLLWCVSSI